MNLDLNGLKLSDFKNADEMLKNAVEFNLKLNEFMCKLDDEFRDLLALSIYKKLTFNVVCELSWARRQLSDDYLADEFNRELTHLRLESIIDKALLNLEIADPYLDFDRFLTRSFDFKMKSLTEYMSPIEVSYVRSCCEYKNLKDHIYWLVS